MSREAPGGRSAPDLVLASSSPRRKKVLERLGLAFDVVAAPEGVEGEWRGEDPAEYARRAAAAKASATAELRPASLVLAADTIVVLDGDVLGKPASEGGAREMLARLSGCEHEVLTAVAIVPPEKVAVDGIESTRVRFRNLAAEEIAAYVATGEPLDKAGAYGIQGFGAALVEEIHGCYFSVMGLPVARLLRLLRKAGYAYEFPGTLRPVS